jgi:Zn-dependent peptidase ImmA (M78 family)
MKMQCEMDYIALSDEGITQTNASAFPANLLMTRKPILRIDGTPYAVCLV